MAYRLLVSRQAGRFLEALPAKQRGQVWQRINALRDDPWPEKKCKKLKGFQPDAWRIRSGDIRVLYRVDKQESIIRVFSVDHRSEDTYD